MKKKLLCIILPILLALTAAYLLLVNFLVSAALVPSFMRKLDSFSRITEQSLSEQVHTDDIQEHHRSAQEETDAWLQNTPHQKLQAKTPEGYTLIAEEFPCETDSHLWVLVLHGYTGWKEEMYPYACWYSAHGFHALVPDLRCQGESEGDFIGMGYTDSYDCLLWLSHILEEDPDASIVLHGQSMGAATALMLAGMEDMDDSLRSHLRAVISDCSYTDAYTMFGNKVREWFSLPAFPIVDTARLLLLLRGGYDLFDASAIDAVRRNRSIPTLFIHGSMDRLIDVSMAELLYEAADCKKKLLIIDGAGHAQACDKEPLLYWNTIEEWITQH